MGLNRVRLYRKWAVAMFSSNETATNADLTLLNVRGPPGVSMKFSMQAVPSQFQGNSREAARGAGTSTGEVEIYPNQGWELLMEAASIDCEHMLTYANISTAGGPCQVRSRQASTLLIPMKPLKVAWAALPGGVQN